MEHRQDVVAALEAALFFPSHESLRQLVIPTPLQHEAIPYLDLLFRGPSAVLETPREDFVVGAALAHAGAEGFVWHADQRVRPLVEALAEIGVELGMQLSGIHQPDFVDHPAEVDDSTDGVFG